MPGLDSIIAKIEADAESAGNRITEDEKLRSAGLREEKCLEARALSESRIAAAEERASKTGERGKSEAEAIVRNALLAEKNLMINEVTKEAVSRLASSAPEVMLGYVETFVSSLGLTRPARIILPSGYSADVPADFETRLSSKAGVQITTDPVRGDFSFGCIAVCGEIEYNGTLESILDDKKDVIRDTANKILFVSNGET